MKQSREFGEKSAESKEIRNNHEESWEFDAKDSESEKIKGKS